MLAALIFAVLFACGSAQDPSCAYITAQPQYMHPGVPQAAAEQKCRTDCAQPGYNCETIAHYYPTICTCGTSPSTPPPTPAPTTPTPGVCSNVAYHQCGGSDGYTGDTCCPYYQGQQQICHRESDQYWQCCPPDLDETFELEKYDIVGTNGFTWGKDTKEFMESCVPPFTDPL